MSHPQVPSSQVSMNYRAVKELYDSIQVLRVQIINDMPDPLSLCNLTEDIAGVEGILLACLHMEMINFDLMNQVTNILEKIAWHHVSNDNHAIYSKPSLLAFDIMMDLPLPYTVAAADDADQQLWDTARAIQEVQAVEEDDEEGEILGYCEYCDGAIYDDSENVYDCIYAYFCDEDCFDLHEGGAE